MTVTIRSHKSQNQANLWCFFTVNPYTMEKRRWLVIGLICLTSGVFLTYKYNVSLVLIEGGSTGYGLHSSNHHIICTRLINLFFGGGGETWHQYWTVLFSNTTIVLPKKNLLSFTTLFHVSRCERWSTFIHAYVVSMMANTTITTQCYLHISGDVHLTNLRSENYPPSNNLRESLMSMVLYFTLQI